MRLVSFAIVLTCSQLLPCLVQAEELVAPADAPKSLRLFNTSVFGKRTTDPLVLLESPAAEKLDPEGVMVDIDKGRYYAATIRYPNTISLEDARKSLNAAYGKWESATFANDPNTGIWRNEDDRIAIQLSENGFNVVVVYIEFSLVSAQKLLRGFTQATQLENDEELARKSISDMHQLLKMGEYAKFYTQYCHSHVRDQRSKEGFVALMKSRKGQEVVELFGDLTKAIQNEEENDDSIARFNERDVDEYEFVLLERKSDKRPWHVELRKEKSEWKLKNFD
jgi:hypothetical protein